MGIDQIINEANMICWYPSSGVDLEKVFMYHNASPYKKPDLYILSDSFELETSFSYDVINSILEKLKIEGFITHTNPLKFQGYIIAEHRFFKLILLFENNHVTYSRIRLIRRCKHFIIHRPMDTFILTEIPLPLNGINSYLKYGFIGSSGTPDRLTYCPTLWQNNIEVVNGPLILRESQYNNSTDTGSIIRIN